MRRKYEIPKVMGDNRPRVAATMTSVSSNAHSPPEVSGKLPARSAEFCESFGVRRRAQNDAQVDFFTNQEFRGQEVATTVTIIHPCAHIISLFLFILGRKPS
jgi:hypothetical protein